MFVFGILLLSITLVSANGDHQSEFEEGSGLIESGISCSELSDEQLESIGDYYMEQMHPGEAHEMMDKMMGGEGSESLRQTHITMAKSIYCNEASGMMNMMMGNNLMGSGSMNMMNSGMMGNWGYGLGYWNFINVLYVVLLIGLIILVYLWIVKLWKSMKNKGDRR